MATYVIGDIQGCFTEFMCLLEKINFEQTRDVLWLTGDLVNRGPDSLSVLRFIKNLKKPPVVVLGNHDLHLLAIAYGVEVMRRDDTLQAILAAPDRDELIDWLRHQPMIHYDKHLHFVMAHAGIAPVWTLAQAIQLAHEVETVLRSAQVSHFLEHLYGNQPDYWDEQLGGMHRLRAIVNYLTRMRFCYADGRLNLTYDGAISGRPPELFPWFELPNQLEVPVNVIFGHWAALDGKTSASQFHALDTGCVWGNCLTAMRLEDQQRFSVHC